MSINFGNNVHNYEGVTSPFITQQNETVKVLDKDKIAEILNEGIFSNAERKLNEICKTEKEFLRFLEIASLQVNNIGDFTTLYKFSVNRKVVFDFSKIKKQLYTNWLEKEGSLKPGITPSHFIQYMLEVDPDVGNFKFRSCGFGNSFDDFLQILCDHGLFEQIPDDEQELVCDELKSLFEEMIDTPILWEEIIKHPIFIGKSKDDLKIIQEKILEIHKFQKKYRGNTLLKWMIEKDRSADAIAVIDAIDRAGKIELSEKDLWLKRAFQGDLNFNDSDFLKLSTKMKEKIYRIGNTYAHEEFIKHLDQLGEFKISNPAKKGHYIISGEMNAVQAKKSIEDFFGELRESGHLLTSEEFKAMKGSNIFRGFKKECAIGRILGKQLVDQKIKELNSKHIKTPDKIIVIEPSNQNPSSIVVELGYELRNDPLSKLQIFSKNLSCYSEKIIPCNRKITFDEFVELIDIIEATEYSDLWPSNFIIAIDGIYFIDTEYKSFRPVEVKNLGRLSTLLKSEDIERFDKLIAEKQAASKNNKKMNAEKHRQELNEYEANQFKSGFSKREKPFTISIENLTKS